MSTPLERVFEVSGCRTQTELAEFLGIRQSSIAFAKKKGTIPPEWLLTLWRKKAANPDWILWGQGAMRLQSMDSSEELTPPTVYIKEIRPPQDCSIEELMIEVVRRIVKTPSN